MHCGFVLGRNHGSVASKKKRKEKEGEGGGRKKKAVEEEGWEGQMEGGWGQRLLSLHRTIGMGTGSLFRYRQGEPLVQPEKSRKTQ